MNQDFPKEDAKNKIRKERLILLSQANKTSEPVLAFLGFVWFVLLIIDLIQGLPYPLLILSYIIWILFIIDFIIKFTIAPQKGEYIKKNILTLISLVIPGIRILRIISFLRFLRAMRATQSIRFARIIASFNRGFRTLNLTLKRRAFGYIMLLTLIVLFSGAGGIYTFESHNGLNSYWNAAWWTAMIITTMGSEYWPKTPAGKILCLILAVYGFAIFGYITATIASFFVGRDAESDQGAVAGTKQIKRLEKEITLLRKEMKKFEKKDNNSND